MLGLPGLVSAACSIGRPNPKLGPAFPRYGLLVAASPIWAAAQRKIAASLSGFDPTGTRRAVHLERGLLQALFQLARYLGDGGADFWNGCYGI